MSRFLSTTVFRHPHSVTISHTIVHPQQSGERLILNEDWLNNVISALENDDIMDAFNGNLTPTQLDFLTTNYGAPPPPPPQRTLSAFKHWVKPHECTFGKRWASENSARTCAICKEDFRSRCKLVVLPACKHVYHKKCISTWLSKYNAKCPLCKVCVEPTI